MRPTQFITAAILLLCLTVNGWAAAITSAAASDWATGATWVGGIAPGDGDTAILAHDVTIADGTTVTVGTSGATGTTAITINDGKKLIIGQGISGTLICRGDIVMTQTNTTRVSGFYAVEVKSGATLEFDASAASTPLSQTYVCRPSGNNQPNSRVKFSGTSGFHATCRSNSGGGNGRFSLGGFNTRLGSITATYTDFLRIGDASNAAFDLYLSSSAVEPDTFDLSYCTLNACGNLTSAVAVNAAAVFSCVRCIWSNTVSTTCWTVNSNTAITTGTRLFQLCHFDKQAGNAGNNCSWTFDRCSMQGSFSVAASSTVNWADLKDCLIVKTAAGTSANQVGGSPVIGGPLTRSYLLTNNTTSTNNKWFNASTNLDIVIDGFHWESLSTADTTGDCFSVTGAPGSTRVFDVQHGTCSFTPGGNDRPGTIISVASTDADWRVRVKHNTWISGTEAMFSFSETSASAANTIDEFKSNYCYAPLTPQGTRQYVAYDWVAGGTPTTDAMVPAGILNNASYGVKAGLGTKGFDATLTTPPDATNLTDTNANFIATSRTLATWADYRGLTSDGDPAATKRATALAAIAADPSLITDLYSWVRGGWVPTNAALKNAGHDGVTIGALEGVFTEGGAARNRNRTGGLRRMSRDLLNRGTSIQRNNFALAA
jgi:hypothetical protein